MRQVDLPVSKMVGYIGVGGFLGAGKTTALARLAKHFSGKGMKVGIVTNDQAKNLVDTENLEYEGNIVREVSGGCFCCNFNDLLNAINALQDNNEIDVILAEPVGSCTDIVATVIQPLIDLFGDRVEVAPHSVLIDPIRLIGTLIDRDSELSRNVVYIYEKQLEEADLLVLNKIDSISQQGVNKVVNYLVNTFPNKKILPVSALTGEGFPEWINIMESEKLVGRNITEVDYDIYANGEAMLGWLNATAEVFSRKAFDSNRLLTDLLCHLKKNLLSVQKETAHLKVLIKTAIGIGIANLISNFNDPVISKRVIPFVNTGKLVINARVEIDPQVLKEIVMGTLHCLGEQYDMEINVCEIESFKPGRPQPTYRYSSSRGA